MESHCQCIIYTGVLNTQSESMQFQNKTVKEFPVKCNLCFQVPNSCQLLAIQKFCRLSRLSQIGHFENHIIHIEFESFFKLKRTQLSNSGYNSSVKIKNTQSATPFRKKRNDFRSLFGSCLYNVWQPSSLDITRLCTPSNLNLLSMNSDLSIALFRLYVSFLVIFCIILFRFNSQLKGNAR